MAMVTFIRGYARVLDATEASDDEVVLERRAGRPTFVLATLRRVHADRHAVAAVAHVLRHALGTEEGGEGHRGWSGGGVPVVGLLVGIRAGQVHD